ncbi:MAG: hypothetical protein C0432_01605 [Candidatus Puniceispirillum sp.]|nr:hypothetical protein [Candidatus Pelagibacter sp.]MBA4282975.1 hypothetical protein [Candidatus Puniceispirillum sp.]
MNINFSNKHYKIPEELSADIPQTLKHAQLPLEVPKRYTSHRHNTRRKNHSVIFMARCSENVPRKIETINFSKPLIQPFLN